MTSPDEDAGEWASLDRWLLKEGEDEGGAVATASLQDRPITVEGGTLSQTSAGHQHEHFYSKAAGGFAELGASERLVANLAWAGVTRPSVAQADAFGAVLRGESMVLAQPSGTGKTLAYLAPLIQRLWEWEEADGPTKPGEVRAAVLVSSPELAQQVLALARQLAKRKLKCTAATGEHNWATQRERVSGGLDLLVGTLGRVCALTEPRGRKPSPFSAPLRALVVDDADALYCLGGTEAQRCVFLVCCLNSQHRNYTSCTPRTIPPMPKGLPSEQKPCFLASPVLHSHYTG